MQPVYIYYKNELSTLLNVSVLIYNIIGASSV